MVSAITFDPNTGNNSSIAIDRSTEPGADLGVTKTSTPDPVNAGSNITYTITVNNGGPANAQLTPR